MTDRQDIDVSFVVPCFNEADCLPFLYKRLADVSSDLALNAVEFILVDDGSTDGSWTVFQRLTAEDERVVVVRLSRNYGHQKALSAGLEQARGAQVLVIDADLQDPPELLGDMRAAIADGADVVYGQRRKRDGESWFKRWSARMFYRVIRALSDTDVPLDTGDFRLMTRHAVDLLLAMPERQRFVRGMVAWIGLDQRPIVYDRAARLEGETKYPFRRMIGLALNGITSFSIVPLRIASGIGAIMTLIALLLLIYTGLSWIFLDTVSGWTSLMAVMLTIGGVQLLVLGIVGEYIGRIYLEVKGRPVYLVDRILRGDTETRPVPQTAHRTEIKHG